MIEGFNLTNCTQEYFMLHNKEIQVYQILSNNLKIKFKKNIEMEPVLISIPFIHYKKIMDYSAECALWVQRVKK